MISREEFESKILSGEIPFPTDKKKIRSSKFFKSVVSVTEQMHGKQPPGFEKFSYDMLVSLIEARIDQYEQKKKNITESLKKINDIVMRTVTFSDDSRKVDGIELPKDETLIDDSPMFMHMLDKITEHTKDFTTKHSDIILRANAKMYVEIFINKRDGTGTWKK